MNSTIDYYNKNAQDYYQATCDAGLDAARARFAAYLPAGAKVIDIGCGSGRDVAAFSKMGYNASGLDASEKLVKLAKEKLEINAFAADMSEWISDEPYDGIWCCASLMHLSEEESKRFFRNLQHNLKPGGAIYISVKSGIETGTDEAGRYFRDFNEEQLRQAIAIAPGLTIRELWYTEDTLNRTDFKWLNAIAVR